jgi:uncharacterized protein with HEPN domain
MSRKRELRVTDYLQHILDAIERIDSYLAGGDEQAFAQACMAQDAVIPRPSTACAPLSLA